MVAQVEDRLVDAARVAARAGAHGGAVRGAAGRASRVWEGVRRRRPDHQHQQARASTGSGTPGGGIAAPGRSVVSLKMLVAAGLMRPGPEALWITYLDQTWHGALDAAGAIAFQDQTFYSPSAWAIHCKRLANPGKKADDGWKSVRYGSAEGPTLHDVKLAFLAGVGRGTPGSAGRAREADGAKAQQTLGFARQELPVASAGESPASDRKRRTGLVSGVSSPDAAAELFSSKEEKSDEGQKAAPRATPAKRPREGEVEGELEHQSVKKPSAPSATDMSWLAAFADPADAEGAAERDARFAAAPGGDHASLLGRTVQVFWPSEETWHAGRVLRVEPGAGGASVLYATGDVEQGVVLDALAEKKGSPVRAVGGIRGFCGAKATIGCKIGSLTRVDFFFEERC